MSALSIQPTYPIFTETDGQPLENGYIWIGAANLDPQVNPINVYFDAALTILAPQPIRTLGGYPTRNGTPARLYVNSDYSIRVMNKNGSTVYSASEALERYSGDLISFTGFKGQVGTVADLADNDGSDWIGFEPAGASAVARSAQDKMRDIVSVLDFGADNTGVTDSYAAITAAIASGASTVYFPKGSYAVSQPIVMGVQGLRLLGDGQWKSVITQTGGFSGVATIEINGARLAAIEHLFAGGNFNNGSDAIRVTSGQLATISNVVVKFGVAGVRLIAGNSQRWSNIFAESNQIGFLIDPDAGDNTNGCTMLGLRSFNHSQWGLDVLRGAGPSGHMHSSWNISAEGGSGSGGGIRIRGGRYCYYDLYAESNPGDEYDLDGTVANYYFVKNPDNFALPLFSPDALCIGVETIGANMYFDGGFAPDRVTEQVFTASASLAKVGVKMFDVTNTSGTTRTMTLSFLSYSPVGFKATITKRDNTAGFTLAAPAGITLTGDTSTFGGFATSVKQLVISKINSTTAVLVQSGA